MGFFFWAGHHFMNPLAAVRWALDIQQLVRNVDVSEEHRIEFRIGINIGDVIIDEVNVYGDGVTVAARLEALAEPGGICVSVPTEKSAPEAT